MIKPPTFMVTARIGPDGAATAKIVACCEYGNRSAYTSEDVTDDEILTELQEIGERLIDISRENLTAQSQYAAAKAYTVAAENGEQI